MSNWSIWCKVRILSGVTTPAQSGPVSDDNERDSASPQLQQNWSRTIRMCSVIYRSIFRGGSYSTAECIVWIWDYVHKNMSLDFNFMSSKHSMIKNDNDILFGRVVWAIFSLSVSPTFTFTWNKHSLKWSNLHLSLQLWIKNNICWLSLSMVLTLNKTRRMTYY